MRFTVHDWREHKKVFLKTAAPKKRGFYFGPRTKRKFLKAMDRRAQTKETIGRMYIPKTAVAGVSGLSSTEVSAYLHGHTVSDANCLRIEHATEDIANLITVMEDHIGIRPDLKNVDRLRDAIEGLKIARKQAVEQQLEGATQAANAALRELASA